VGVQVPPSVLGLNSRFLRLFYLIFFVHGVI
jgi:hypothetical protein